MKVEYWGSESVPNIIEANIYGEKKEARKVRIMTPTAGQLPSANNDSNSGPATVGPSKRCRTRYGLHKWATEKSGLERHGNRMSGGWPSMRESSFDLLEVRWNSEITWVMLNSSFVEC
jgi:hypothetical protein